MVAKEKKDFVAKHYANRKWKAVRHGGRLREKKSFLVSVTPQGFCLAPPLPLGMRSAVCHSAN